ncbi:MAG: sulfatase [Verrucomicrobia bacterium]|nr:sulfatase [Verrucomicrobiota bacterium]
MKLHHLASTKLRGFAISLGFLLFLGITAFGKSDRPNIVFILVDDLRADALSISGHPFSKTPHIDRIGNEGAMFKNAFVTTPLCSPARASFLTGQYVHKNGVLGNGALYSQLSHELITFPRLLRDAGYESAYVGKWHMGNDDSPRPGFDHWVSFKGQGVYENPPININGTSKKVEGYMTDILNEHAVSFVKQPHSKPFVLYFSHKAVHGPFTPAERHKGIYADKKITMSPSAKDTLEGKLVLIREVEEKGKKMSNVQRQMTGQGRIPEGTIRGQLESMLSIDEGVGQLLKALEETQQLDNTIVIFTSDNGYLWAEHGLGDKRWAYEESIRIPLLVRYPKLIKAGLQPEQLALNIDIAPTLLQLAGAPVPKDIDGKSLLPVFKSKKADLRELAFLEYIAEPNYPRQAGWQAVRSHRYKYIHYTELSGMDEFYDLKSDPYEMKNLINDSKVKKSVAQYKAEQQKFFPKN